MLLLEGRRISAQEAHAEGRRLLRQMYESCTGEKMPAISVNSRGKPHFVGGALYFSITHTRGHVFCALSDKPVGIDAEEMDRNISLALADKILSPGERRQNAAAADKRLALLTFWVLKEAQVKCEGTGLRGYPVHTDFSLDDPRVQTRDGCILAVIEEETHAF